MFGEAGGAGAGFGGAGADCEGVVEGLGPGGYELGGWLVRVWGGEMGRWG